MKRKIILYIAQSLDGYIACKDGSIDWLPENLSEKMVQFYETFVSGVDTVLMGKNVRSNCLRN